MPRVDSVTSWATSMGVLWFAASHNDEIVQTAKPRAHPSEIRCVAET